MFWLVESLIFLKLFQSRLPILLKKSYQILPWFIVSFFMKELLFWIKNSNMHFVRLMNIMNLLTKETYYTHNMMMFLWQPKGILVRDEKKDKFDLLDFLFFFSPFKSPASFLQFKTLHPHLTSSLIALLHWIIISLGQIHYSREVIATEIRQQKSWKAPHAFRLLWMFSCTFP